MGVRRTLPTRVDGKADDRYKSAKPKRSPKPVAMADLSDLAAMDPETLARHLSHEALLITAGIMRRPGRNAQSQLAAAREILQRGCKPMAPDRDAIDTGNTFVVNVNSIPAPRSATTVTAVTTRLIGGGNAGIRGLS